MREKYINIKYIISDKYIFYIFDTHLCNTPKTKNKSTKRKINNDILCWKN